jgi:putative FmdB family regulatory protein
MPNYDFECQDCHQVFEVRATIKEMEEGEISCTKCNSKDIKRIFNGCDKPLSFLFFKNN